MDKINVDSINSEEITEWIFPQIDISRNQDDVIEVVKSEEENVDEQNDYDNEMIVRQKAEALELERQREELKSKIAIVNNLLNQIKEPLSFVNDDLINLLQLVVKKTIKNIIGKEIKSDPKLINKMINDLKELIHEKDGAMTVYLSDIDFKRFNHDESDHLLFVKSDSTLKEGDLIIKSNYAEIRALLDTRLDKMIGAKND